MFLVTKLIHVHSNNYSYNYFTEHLYYVGHCASRFIYIISFGLYNNFRREVLKLFSPFYSHEKSIYLHSWEQDSVNELSTVTVMRLSSEVVGFNTARLGH